MENKSDKVQNHSHADPYPKHEILKLKKMTLGQNK